MSILVFAEHEENIFKKSSFEAVTYGKDLATKLNTTCVAVCIACSDKNASNQLATYGADSVINVSNAGLSNFDSGAYAAAVSEIAQDQQANVLIFSNTYTGKALAPRVAARIHAAIASGIVEMVDLTAGFTVKKSCFSNKAFAYVKLNSENKVLALVPNSYELKNNPTNAVTQDFAVQETESKTTVVGVSKEKGKIPLTEAEIVVSAGRGLKGPENWGMIEELADLLNAATACSKPVSDMEWRPHSEHVGQTGITIKPNLYIAIGISGAIQHLAGVGSSKVICVINKDPEAPFFKAADFGIVGDAFEVVPKIIARAKELHLA
jgi:electron transfer flavoprotein alpha subunit